MKLILFYSSDKTRCSRTPSVTNYLEIRHASIIWSERYILCYRITCIVYFTKSRMHIQRVNFVVEEMSLVFISELMVPRSVFVELVFSNVWKILTELMQIVISVSCSFEILSDLPANYIAEDVLIMKGTFSRFDQPIVPVLHYAVSRWSYPWFSPVNDVNQPRWGRRQLIIVSI